MLKFKGNTLLNRFGELLKFYRRQCTDPQRGGILTQARLGELLGDILGDAGYSGAAISYWESGKSQIDKDYRAVLIGLIKILLSCGGLHTLAEAVKLLLSGNYRALDEDENQQLLIILAGQQDNLKVDDPDSGSLDCSMAALEIKLANSDELPNSWTGEFLKLFGFIVNSWDSSTTFQTIYWLMVWFITWRLAFAYLEWPFASRESVQLGVIKYIGCSLFVPALIALARKTKCDSFWQQRLLENSSILRFYTYLGSYTGFHVGCLFVFGITLIGYYLKIKAPPSWVIGLAASFPLVLGYAAADQAPFNQWRAYGRLRFRDGAVFTPAFLFGPIWGIFFFEYHELLLSPIVGIPILFFAIVLATTILYFQRWKDEKTSQKPD
jgi:hypothetical protein